MPHKFGIIEVIDSDGDDCSIIPQYIEYLVKRNVSKETNSYDQLIISMRSGQRIDIRGASSVTNFIDAYNDYLDNMNEQEFSQK